MKKSLLALLIIALASHSLFMGCKDDDTTETPEITPVTEEVDLTHLPFGGVDPTNILIRKEGHPQPDFLSLWLCGLPVDGAGANNATDWTNADGTWDYTRKPQVEGNVSWISEFDVSLDGNGKRIITRNALPDHPTGIFPIDPASIAYQYDRNKNEMVDVYHYHWTYDFPHNIGCYKGTPNKIKSKV